jgi:hypothetical protein
MNREEKMLSWLQKEINKDKAELNNEKLKFAQELKKLKKDDLFVKEKETIWKRIRKMIWGN